MVRVKTPETKTTIAITRSTSGYEWRCEEIERYGYMDRCCEDRSCPFWVVRDTSFSPALHRYDLGDEGLYPIGYAEAKEMLIQNVDHYVGLTREIEKIDRLVRVMVEFDEFPLDQITETHISEGFAYWRQKDEETDIEIQITHEYLGEGQFKAFVIDRTERTDYETERAYAYSDNAFAAIDRAVRSFRHNQRAKNSRPICPECEKPSRMGSSYDNGTSIVSQFWCCNWSKPVGC
jgi:hypothetical protein